MSSLIRRIWLRLSLTLVAVIGAVSEDCERYESRIVQKAIKEDLLPVYESLKLDVPVGCPFYLDKTRYYQQEQMKYKEHPTKFVCSMCGKGFYEERFIDLHMYNRHDNLEYRAADVVCLGDYCDIFRCSIISGHEKPRYWDKALCKDKNLQDARDRCQEMMNSCVSKSFREKDKKLLTDMIDERICSFLTCDNYWNIPEAMVHPVNTAFYVLGFMFMCVALLIYYYIAYTHFYTDESLLDSFNDKPPTGGGSKNQVRYNKYPQYDNIRYRVNTR